MNDKNTAGVDLDKLEALARESKMIPNGAYITRIDVATMLRLIDLARRAEPSVTAGDERALFIANQRRKDSIPNYITDDMIMKGEITQHEWAGWQARAALASPAVSQKDAPTCTHVWNDFGQLGGRNVSWCPRCDTLAWTGKEPATQVTGAADGVAAWANPRDLESDTHIDCWAYKTPNYTVPLYRRSAPRKSIELVDCGTCGCQVSVPVDHFDDAPVSSPMDQELPPLPIEKIVQIADESTDRHFGLILEPFARAIEKEARGQYAERIRQLERELAVRKTASIGDDSKFCELLDDFAYKASERRAMGGDFGSADAEEVAESALIAYIDGHTAGAAPEELVEIGNRMATTLEVLACALKNEGTAVGVRLTVAEWRAAAPTPMNSGKDGTC